MRKTEYALESGREIDAIQRLAVALRSVCGIETRVWLGDIAGLGREDIRELQLWLARAVLARSLDEPPPTG